MTNMTSTGALAIIPPYMNHSCDGNCEAINFDGEIWIVAIQDIKKGDELVYDYGYDRALPEPP